MAKCETHIPWDDKTFTCADCGEEIPPLDPVTAAVREEREAWLEILRVMQSQVTSVILQKLYQRLIDIVKARQELGAIIGEKGGL